MLETSRVVLLAGFALLSAWPGRSSEVWAFRFNSDSLKPSMSWHDDLIFHNPTAQDATVRLLGLSNGGIRPGDRVEVAVPAGRTVSLKDLPGTWETPDAPLIWVVHVEVPDGLLAVSRGGADVECPSPCGSPPNPFPNLGAFSMPVFRSLTPAGQEQIHMGADLGTLGSRFNTGIYNAGHVSANATVAVYQACDDTLLETGSVSITADTAVQFGGLGSVPTHCPAETPLNTWLRYARVTVDQPSLSYIVNIADPFPAGFQIPLVVPIGP